MSTSFQYSLTDGYYVITNLTTPYGVTSFSYVTPTAGLYGTTANDNVNRAVTVTEPNGAHHLFLYRDKVRFAGGDNVYTITPYYYDDIPDYIPVYPSPIGLPGLGNYNMIYRNSFYWGPRQYDSLSTTDPLNLSTNDYTRARL